MQQGLELQDVRQLLRILGELRELGADPAAWRGHLVNTLQTFCGADVCVIAELRVNEDLPEDLTNCAQAVTSLQAIDCGLSAPERELFYREIYFTDHTTDDVLGAIVPLYGSAFTVRRAQVVADRQWDRSFSANERFRRAGCDDFVKSMMPVPRLGVISSLELYRAPGRRFEERERALLSLLHEELATDWNRDELRNGVRVTPRQKQVLSRLCEGASEKEIAYELDMSIHTVHDHIKALHRTFGARSRGELLKEARGRLPARTRLVAEAQSAR